MCDWNHSTVALASLPGRSHRQYFIASSMKYDGGSLGDLVTSDDVRQMVDTRGAVANR